MGKKEMRTCSNSTFELTNSHFTTLLDTSVGYQLWLPIYVLFSNIFCRHSGGVHWKDSVCLCFARFFGPVLSGYSTLPFSLSQLAFVPLLIVDFVGFSQVS
mmetsp:Transcript_5457/g.5993  ORF Transcript_5457/g.5993 Transcript_5457/m.5993 type:complete len:101 (-) Transcript_5457:188-490(-)